MPILHADINRNYLTCQSCTDYLYFMEELLNEKNIKVLYLLVCYISCI